MKAFMLIFLVIGIIADIASALPAPGDHVRREKHNCIYLDQQKEEQINYVVEKLTQFLNELAEEMEDLDLTVLNLEIDQHFDDEEEEKETVLQLTVNNCVRYTYEHDENYGQRQDRMEPDSNANDYKNATAVDVRKDMKSENPVAENENKGTSVESSVGTGSEISETANGQGKTTGLVKNKDIDDANENPVDSEQTSKEKDEKVKSKNSDMLFNQIKASDDKNNVTSAEDSTEKLNSSEENAVIPAQNNSNDTEKERKMHADDTVTTQMPEINYSDNTENKIPQTYRNNTNESHTLENPTTSDKNDDAPNQVKENDDRKVIFEEETNEDHKITSSETLKSSNFVKEETSEENNSNYVGNLDDLNKSDEDNSKVSSETAEYDQNTTIISTTVESLITQDEVKGVTPEIYSLPVDAYKSEAISSEYNSNNDTKKSITEDKQSDNDTSIGENKENTQAVEIEKTTKLYKNTISQVLPKYNESAKENTIKNATSNEINSNIESNDSVVIEADSLEGDKPKTIPPRSVELDNENDNSNPKKEAFEKTPAVPEGMVVTLSEKAETLRKAFGNPNKPFIIYIEEKLDSENEDFEDNNDNPVLFHLQLPDNGIIRSTKSPVIVFVQDIIGKNQRHYIFFE